MRLFTIKYTCFTNLNIYEENVNEYQNKIPFQKKNQKYNFLNQAGTTVDIILTLHH